MIKPDARTLAITGALSVFFTALPLILGGTKLEWLEVPFWLPGVLAAAILFQTGIHSDHPVLFLGLAVVFNLLISWFVLLLVVKWIQKSISRRRVQA